MAAGFSGTIKLNAICKPRQADIVKYNKKIYENKPFNFSRGKVSLFLASLSNFLINLLTNL